MVATVTTKPGLAADSTQFGLAVVDKSGTGAGPFFTVHALSDPQGNLFDLTGNLGTAVDAAAASDSGTFSLTALLKRLVGKIPLMGQALASASLPVVLASNHSLIKVDGSTVTQPVSGALTANLGTLNGAATAAKQPAPGVAGTASADVVSVQGIASGTPLLTTQAASETHLGEIGGSAVRAFASFGRPSNTTAYASGQLVANSTSAGAVSPLALVVARKTGGTGTITAVKVSKTSTSATNATFRVHFYRNSPTPTNGDGAVWLTTSSIYFGYADVVMDKVFTDEVSGVGVPKDASGTPRSIVFDTAAGSTNIYALIEARAAYTPVSGETFTVTVEASRN